MSATIEVQRGGFLNTEQKELKNVILNSLFDAFSAPLKNKEHLFLGEEGSQAMTDLILSVMIMFNREIITRICLSLDEDYIEKFIQTYLNCIGKEIHTKLIESKGQKPH
jgi:hypothetical protein